jgi:hypothetical protein
MGDVGRNDLTEKNAKGAKKAISRGSSDSSYSPSMRQRRDVGSWLPENVLELAWAMKEVLWMSGH